MRSKWFVPLNDTRNATGALLCFPFAGGSAGFFRSWHDHLPPGIALYGVDLPGRGARFTEPLLDTLPSVVEALVAERKHLPAVPYVFFGHSLGALLAYEFAVALEAIGDTPTPVSVVTSGASAPHVERVRDPMHHLPDDPFKDELRDLQATPPEVLEHQELMDLLLPMLRADFRIAEASEACRSRVPLSVPLVAAGGIQDSDVDIERLGEWERYSTAGFDHWRFSGGHFYLNEHRAELSRRLCGLLQIGTMPRQVASYAM